MLDKLMEHKFRILLAVVIIMCFGCIRAFENSLFYDPFLEYFESDFKNLPYPKVELLKLFCGLFFRYFLNTVLSLALIYVLFNDADILKFSFYIYVFFMVFLLIAFFVILDCFPNAGWLLFYVRRFIIQPIFVILFIPAFYYQQQNLKK